MNRQGTEDPPPLPSQLLSSDAQQPTLPAYREMLGDFLQKTSFQTCASASLPPTQLSVDRTSNSQSQHSGNIKSEDRDNISDSGATTEPLTHDLENHHYWYEARQVEKSLKI